MPIELKLKHLRMGNEPRIRLHSVQGNNILDIMSKGSYMLYGWTNACISSHKTYPNAPVGGRMNEVESELGQED